MNKYELERALRALQRSFGPNSCSWWFVEGVLAGLQMPLNVDPAALADIKSKANAL